MGILFWVKTSQDAILFSSCDLIIRMFAKALAYRFQLHEKVTNFTKYFIVPNKRGCGKMRGEILENILKTNKRG